MGILNKLLLLLWSQWVRRKYSLLALWLCWGLCWLRPGPVRRKGRAKSLWPLDECFIVMCRLRQGFHEGHPAHLFNVSTPTVSRIVITWINFMHNKFGHINTWPSREVKDSTVTDAFKKKYGSTRVIIVCTEIRCQMPKDLLPLGVSLNLPPFLGGSNQMPAEEVVTCKTQEIASLRIHIERAINKIKNFHIWDWVTTLHQIGVVNQMWTVCAFLCNAQPNIISVWWWHWYIISLLLYSSKSLSISYYGRSMLLSIDAPERKNAKYFIESLVKNHNWLCILFLPGVNLQNAPV